MNVQVAVRLRPFNEREKQIKSDLCVKMENNQTILLDEKGNVERVFAFDHSFWSFDGYTDNNGYYEPKKNKNYADQSLVYEKIGKDLLYSALQGYHCCLFAYGQTGAGKSYSIFGYGKNQGIVPQMCKELLSGDHLKQSDDQSFLLSVSMYEIYNEKIFDLLSPIENRTKGGLKIRENSKLGVFVEGIQKFAVNNYEEIRDIIEQGNQNKTIASTQMNQTSSRAHTIINLELIQKQKTSIKTTQKNSTIYLVDLAGSEKQGKTEATKDRLKEACSINTSLSALGKVIRELCQMSSDKKKKIVISYRDSILTRILQNSLGGNSKTTMVCAISPARDNYEENLSTLRYADQAKQIKLKAVINETETDKLIRELMEENQKLKTQLHTIDKDFQNKNTLDIQDQIREIEANILIQDKPTTEIIASAFQSTLQFAKRQQNLNRIHIKNLNEDPLLSGKIIYDFENYTILSIGKTENEQNQGLFSKVKTVILKGLNILDNHLQIINENNQLYIELTDQFAGYNTFINGQFCDFAGQKSFKYQLKDLDRIIIGTSSTFLIRVPHDGKLSEEKLPNGIIIDWEYCQNEKFEITEKEEKEIYNQKIQEKEKEFEKEKQELLIKIENEQKKNQEQIMKQQQDFQKQLVDIKNSEINDKEREIQQKQVELQNLQIIREIEEQMNAQKEESDLKLNQLKIKHDDLKKQHQLQQTIQSKLIHYYPKIQEANLTAQELNRKIIFIPINTIRILNYKNPDEMKLINVKVINNEDGWINYWTLDKFEDRLVLMQEAIDYYFDNNAINYDEYNDPFWDPKEFFPYAEGICLLKGVIYKFNLDVQVGLLCYNTENIGTVQVKLIPLDEDGEELNDEDQDDILNPSDLIEKNISCNFRIEISNLQIQDSKEISGKNAYISYKVMTQNGMTEYKSMPFKFENKGVNLYFSQFINLQKVTTDIINYYMKNQLEIQLFVEDIEKVEVLGKSNPPVIQNLKNFSRRDTISNQSTLNPKNQKYERKTSWTNCSVF